MIKIPDIKAEFVESQSYISLTEDYKIPRILNEWVRMKLESQFVDTIADSIVIDNFIKQLLYHLVQAGIIFCLDNDEWVVSNPRLLFRWIKR